ncbi:Hypothetical_protein [Hexamita inflata]|uniref:Hypothetical_protein n=1 Tax=Hexamita inflata TaxID=28002 RepID=A0AA86QX83_9EUKA|nr:Hypothetical protein HINF_LOCUS52557 [Hexamita inflata]
MKTFIIERLWWTMLFKWSLYRARIICTKMYFIYCSVVLVANMWRGVQATQNGGENFTPVSPEKCCFQCTNQFNAAYTGCNFIYTCSPSLEPDITIFVTFEAVEFTHSQYI